MGSVSGNTRLQTTCRLTKTDQDFPLFVPAQSKKLMDTTNTKYIVQPNTVDDVGGQKRNAQIIKA